MGKRRANRKPIPARLLPDFLAEMSIVGDDDMSDAMWMHELEAAAERFMDRHDIPGDAYDAFIQYIDSQEE